MMIAATLQCHRPGTILLHEVTPRRHPNGPPFQELFLQRLPANLLMVLA